MRPQEPAPGLAGRQPHRLRARSLAPGL